MAEEYVSNSGASLTYPLECGQVKKGGHVLIRGFPCKVRFDLIILVFLVCFVFCTLHEKKKKKKALFLLLVFGGR
jgi:hypothetical protein